MNKKDNGILNIGKAKGIYLEVGGNIKNDGLIIADKDSRIQIRTTKNYSGKGSIIQDYGKKDKKDWFSMSNPITWIIAGLILTILIAIVSTWLGFPLRR